MVTTERDMTERDEILTVPLRLLAKSSNPSLVVSAGNDKGGPNRVPSDAFLS